MPVQTQEALLLRQEMLNLIPGKRLDYVLKRKGIKKDLIIGLVGERGGGKSGSGAVMSLMDFAMDGIKLFSNMHIACNMEISDEGAQEFGLRKGGIARYRSLPIDMPRLMHFDEMYRNSIIFFDEINVEIAEARRCMTNTNLFSNRLAQELRHLESAIIFTCISEMAVDPRWRDIVDVFIKSEETAYYEENIASGKPQGVDFAWTVYFMNRCFNGHTYQETQKPIRDVIFHFKPWRGIYDDKEFQGKHMVKYGVQVNKEGEEVASMALATTDSKAVSDDKRDWGWFEPILANIFKSFEEGKEVPVGLIQNAPEVKSRHIQPKELNDYLLEVYHIKRAQHGGFHTICYELAEPTDAPVAGVVGAPPS